MLVLYISSSHTGSLRSIERLVIFIYSPLLSKYRTVIRSLRLDEKNRIKVAFFICSTHILRISRKLVNHIRIMVTTASI